MERSELERAIIGLGVLLDDPDVSEEDLQKFIEEHPSSIEALGFVQVIPHHRLPDAARPGVEGDHIHDFLLIDHDGFVAVLDLKKPSPKLLKEKGGRTQFRDDVDTGIAQLIDYAEWFDESANRERLTAELEAQAVKNPACT